MLVNVAVEGRMLGDIRNHRMQSLNRNEFIRVCLYRQSDCSIKMIIQKEQSLTGKKTLNEGHRGVVCIVQILTNKLHKAG